MQIFVTIGSGGSEGAGAEFPTFPLTCVVVLKTLWHWDMGSHVLRTTTQVNGKVVSSTPAPSETPEPIVTKICMGDYVGDPYPCEISSRYDYPRLPPKYATAYSQDPYTDFHDQYVK